MKKFKSDKGVTLIILTLTIIVLVLITGVTIGNLNGQLALKKLNNLYGDIDSISTKVSDYYLKNNSLPVYDNKYLSKENLKLLFTSKGQDDAFVNINDNDNYYVLNLSKLENLTLNYGRDYKKWPESGQYDECQDLYIINEQTHQIYYPEGVEYQGDMFFTRENSNNVQIEKVTTQKIAGNGITIASINNIRKDTLTGGIVLTVDVKLNIQGDLEKDTLKYFWKEYNYVDGVKYTPFSIDSNNTATLSSRKLSTSITSCILEVKILDKNGNEYTASSTVNVP